jgi:hypothetical protein
MAIQTFYAEARLNGIQDHLLNTVNRSYELEPPADTITPADILAWAGAGVTALPQVIGASVETIEYVVWFNDDTNPRGFMSTVPAVGTENESLHRVAEMTISVAANPANARTITIPGVVDTLTLLNQATGKKDLLDTTNPAVTDIQNNVILDAAFEFLDLADITVDTVSTGLVRSTKSYAGGGGGRSG